MAGRAGHQGLALSVCHQFRPCGPWMSWLAEVGELADLVHAHTRHDHKHDDHDATGHTRADRLTESEPEPVSGGRRYRQ